ncbi:Vps52-domain-containing protein [Trametes coccinea BRFM310]|uniref:Vps52-domain-containing protein n=1 Tax=Trametes coccinea (strain BRFM310) TaxID=1353009 RepID=A0A1Y2IA81_TRAC3|nr:Vps52-domain-containing protein [Trametes coccinea BRFM310]
MPDSHTQTLSDNFSASGSGMSRSEQPYQLRAREFVELHDQVQTSVNLLDSLENFLSTFQKDLSAVSGQISNLQDRSKDIDNRLKSRRRIEKPLSNLLVDLCIPPALATLILDTRVDEDWIPAITEFERKLDTLKVRVRVKAARDLSEVAEGLRIVAATKLRTFFLSLLEPIKSSMTTNLQVIQSSVWMKYRPLYVFLQRHAPNVAHEIQRTYAATVRTYYETGFRRYLRGLSWIKARTVEKSETIVSGAGESPDPETDPARLSYARVEGPSVVMAYMADDKNHKEPLEALVRSALLVLMDNATAEYSFITTFFANEPRPVLHSKDSSSLMMSPTLLSPTQGEFDESRSNPGSDFGGESVAPRRRLTSITSVMSAGAPEQPNAKEELAALKALWKQVMDPVLDYCQTFIQNAIEPPPPVIPLLTIIRLTEDVVAEVQRRGCGPLETYIFALRLKMWPAFQKLMSEHVDSLKKFAEGATSGYFRRGTTTDAAVSSICRRYVAVFNSFVALTDQAEETMIFSNLLRLRQELSKLIVTHTDKQTDPAAKARALSKFYEELLQGLSNGPHPTSHPKAQSELAYWRQRDEEARRRVASTHGRR